MNVLPDYDTPAHWFFWQTNFTVSDYGPLLHLLDNIESRLILGPEEFLRFMRDSIDQGRMVVDEQCKNVHAFSCHTVNNPLKCDRCVSFKEHYPTVFHRALFRIRNTVTIFRLLREVGMSYRDALLCLMKRKTSVRR
jgi:hypothetical protein